MAKKKDEMTTTDWEQFEIGDQVKHPKWGVGTVLFLSGAGDTAKAIVVFPEEGQKKLMLKFADLTRVGTTSLKSVEKLKAEVESQNKAKARVKARPVAKPKPAVVADEEDEVAELDDEDVDLELEVDDDVELDDEEVAGFDDDEEEHFKLRGDKGEAPE
jgi:hypothetical protein